MEFKLGGRYTSQPSPQEPGSEDKTKSDFISVEMSREFSQQENLEGESKETQKKRR
jgi:hypothetical protein